MAKNVLFLVTGMTPQIITETVWALACDPQNTEQWIPDEIQVLSTEHGLTQIRASLFADGHFAQLLADYHLPDIHFDETCLHSIDDAEGIALSDLKTPADNELAANTICDMIREFTNDAKVNLHVSIAGGRKTMGFYAGYALSLYGRANDRMSHVLVSSEFEASREFFYPALQPKTVFVSPFGKNERLDAYDAKIWLANIPFVRLRSSLPESSLIKQASFSDVVTSINMAQQPLKICLNIKNKTVQIGEKFAKLAPREFAFYCWFAERAMARDGSIPTIVEGEHRSIPRLFELWKGRENLDPTDAKSGTFDKPFFEQRLAKIKSLFSVTFGEDVAKLVLVQLKNGRGSGYVLPLKPEQIEILEE